jgi:TonB family protein
MEILQPANLMAWALQAGVIVLVAAPLPRLLGMWSPRVRMGYWRVVLLGCLWLPLLQPWIVREEPVRQLSPIAASVDVTGPATAASGTNASVPAPVRQTARWWWPPVGVTEVLIAGILLRLAWLGLGVFTVGRLRRSARPLWPRPASVDRAASLAETDAEFLVSATSSRPVTCGLLWPVVLVPRNFETFPEHEQTAIACHELLHVSRADWARNAFDEVVRAILWFHPGIWWVINEIQLAREQVVDREAVRRLGTRAPYLEALLRLARPAPRLVLTPASLFLKRAHLRQRVTLLVKEASMSRARLVGSLAVMAVVIFIGGRMASAAFPLQQAGATTPGVATAAPKLIAAKLGAIDIENGSLRGALSTYTSMTGIAITTVDIPDRLLDQPITMKFAAGVSPERVLDFIAKAIDGTYRVTSERSVVLTGKAFLAAAQSSGSATGAPRPGMTTSAGAGAGSGSGSSVAGTASGQKLTDAQFARILEYLKQANKFETDEQFQAALKTEHMTLADLRRNIERTMPAGAGVGGGVAGGVGSGVSGGVGGGVSGGHAPAFDTGGFFAGSMGTGTTNPVTRVLPSVPGATGTAKVYVTIDSTGHVERTDFVAASGDLVGPSVEAATQWVFEPSGLPERQTVIAFNFPAASGITDTEIVRIGGSIPPPVKIRDVKPVYPQEAVNAHIQGVQILEITVDPSGNVVDARALRGQRVLVGPAIDAVLQWKFAPWDGPERRLMTVTVNFTLDSGPKPDVGMPVRDASAQQAMAPSPGVPYGMATDWPADAVRVGGNIRPPSKIADVKAVYPDVAQKARVQGVVIFDVLIGPDGKVKDARVLRSIPLLDRAAYDAVLQWEFTPTLLNGNPISIVMTVTVNFTLQ